jgi:hypothetical protein
MKKLLFSLFLAVLIGVGFTSLSNAQNTSSSSNVNVYNRTIPLKYGYAASANTLIVAHGGYLRYISGNAGSANAVWSIHDASSINNATNFGGVDNSITNIMVEGGQATQYGSIAPNGYIDFGDNGIQFNNGLVVITTTANLTVGYY